jgi:hypothetical protein
MSFLRSRVLFVTVVASLMAGGSFTIAGVASAGATPAGVHCDAGDNLQAAISLAPPGATITVDGICHGNFTIFRDLTLVGPATLDGDNAGTVLLVGAGTVTLNNLTIQHGAGTNLGASVFGGGIDNNATLTVIGSTVSNNSALGVTPPQKGVGGGIVNTGTLTLNRSTVSNNTASDLGGGIFNFGFAGQATLTLNGSTVSNNTSSTSSCNDGCGGGGISNGGNAPYQGVVTINQSTLSGNTVLGQGDGGAINSAGPTTLNSSTLSSNIAFVGGAIFVESSLSIHNGTVSNNSAAVAGAIAIYSDVTTVVNSTFSNNPGFTFGQPTAGIFVFPQGFFNSPGGTLNPIHSTFS